MTIASKIALGKFLWSIRGPFRRLNKRAGELARAERDLALRKTDIEARIHVLTEQTKSMSAIERVELSAPLLRELTDLETEEIALQQARQAFEAGIRHMDAMASDRRPHLKLVRRKTA